MSVKHVKGATELRRKTAQKLREYQEQNPQGYSVKTIRAMVQEGNDSAYVIVPKEWIGKNVRVSKSPI